MSLDEQLRTAIAGRRLIEVTYNGRARVAEPHDYGVQAGHERLLVYQLRERGASQSARGWRLLEVAKIEAVTVLADLFPGSRGAAHQRHYEWETVYARVE